MRRTEGGFQMSEHPHYVQHREAQIQQEQFQQEQQQHHHHFFQHHQQQQHHQFYLYQNHPQQNHHFPHVHGANQCANSNVNQFMHYTGSVRNYFSRHHHPATRRNLPPPATYTNFQNQTIYPG